jgi:hypothetical protein
VLEVSVEQAGGSLSLGELDEGTGVDAADQLAEPARGKRRGDPERSEEAELRAVVAGLPGPRCRQRLALEVANRPYSGNLIR